MNILIIDNREKPNPFWEDMIPLLFPEGNQIFRSINNWHSSPLPLNNLELVILFSENRHHYFEEIVEYFDHAQIPFLYIMDNYTSEDFQYLSSKKVKGLIQTSNTSLKDIEEIINLVIDGGVHLQAPRLKKI